MTLLFLFSSFTKFKLSELISFSFICSNTILIYLWDQIFYCSYNFLLGNRSGQYIWEDHRPRSGIWKGTSGGEVISFSGCDDDQTSADTSVSF